MPEAAILAVAEALGADLLFAEVILQGVQIAALVTSVYVTHDAARKQQNAARDAANASQRDRYVQYRSAYAPRQVVLGRQRVSGPLAYIGSYGTQKENLVFVVMLAAHEVDGFEDEYFSDELISLDANGDVLGVNQKDLFTLTGASGTFTLSADPDVASLTAWVDYGTTRVSLTVVATALSVQVSGGTVGQIGTVTVQYRPLVSPYITTQATQKTATLTLNGAGNGSVTLESAPDGGSFVITAPNPNASQGSGALNGDADLNIQAFASINGLVVTVAGATPNAACTVAYTTTTRPSLVNIKRYTGAPGQAADASLMAALPGVWTAAHTLTGIAYAVVRCKYSVSAFASGYPQYSVVTRGAKLFDPRTNTTAWSENPALMMRYVTTSPLLGRQAAAVVNTPALITAANACDVTANYVVDGRTHTRPMYTAGLVVASGTRAKDALDDLAAAMAGNWVALTGQLMVHAGAPVVPLQTLDESWVINVQSIQVQAGEDRGNVYNVVTGNFVDATRDYKALPYPRVESSAYQALDGGEVLPLQVELNAVGFVGQAQQVVAARMRDARQALRLSLVCNMSAYPVQVFDVLYVNLPEFGFVNQKMRVMSTSFAVDGGIALALKKYDSNAWNLGLSFSQEGIAPNTVFNSPVVAPRLGVITCSSGTAQLLRQADGTVLSRMLVSWPTVTDAYVLDGGGVEVKWGRAGEPEAKWQTDKAPNGQASLLVNGVLDTAYYLVKARTYNSLVQGPWSATALHRIVGKTARPPDVTGLSITVTDSGVLVKADRNPEADRGVLEVHNETTWSDLTSPVYAGDADRVLLPRPAAGTYYFAVKFRDSSGNYSLNAALGSVVVSALAGGGGAAVTWTTLSGSPANLASLAGSEAILNSLLQPSITSLITAVSNLGNDNILSPGEKPAAVQAYNVIIADQAGIDAQATVYAITTEKTAYDNAVAALTSYLGTLSGWNTIPGTDVAIVGTTFSQKFADVYTTQRTLLLKIQTALKALSDAAQTAANNAATAASNAQSSANSALNQIADISSDNLLTVDEKPAIIQDSNVIALEQSGIDAQATNYGVTTQKTTYDTAVSALASYLTTLTTPYLWSSLSGNTTIVGTTFRGKFQDIYVARQAVLDAVSAAAKARLGALATLNTVGTDNVDAAAISETQQFVDATGVGSYPAA